MSSTDHTESDGGGVATQAPPKPRPRKKPPKKLPPWKVTLHNDDVNDMGYVVETIVMLTSLSPETAIRRMLEAHTRGATLLLTAHKERAELYRDQFISRKLKVTIEPA